MIILNGHCLNYTEYEFNKLDRTITLKPSPQHSEASLIDYCTMGRTEMTMNCDGDDSLLIVDFIGGNVTAGRFVFYVKRVMPIGEPNVKKHNVPYGLKTPHVKRLEARNAQLLEALTLAHSILLHEMDNGRTPTQLQGVGLGYFEDVIAGLDDAQFRRE